MNKNFCFLLLVLSMILVAGGLVFYPSVPELIDTSRNITFRKDAKLYTLKQLEFEDMISDVDRSFHRRLQVAKYQDKLKLKSNLNDGLLSYVNGDLSLMQGTPQYRVSLNSGTQQGYRRYVSDNSVGPVNINVVNFQDLDISRGGYSHGGGVVQIGGIMATIPFDECTHENVDWDWTNGGALGSCTDCNGKGTITDLNGDGIIDFDDIKWTPLGDFVMPMLLMVLSYLIIRLVNKK